LRQDEVLPPTLSEVDEKNHKQKTGYQMNIPEHIDPRNEIDGICPFGIGWVYLGEEWWAILEVAGRLKDYTGE
jgi:hypothetical protein